MSQKLPENVHDQEIDLVQISNKINQFFKRINRSIFNAIQFFVRNWIIVAVLVIAGFAIGMYLDKTQKIYDNQIIVKPNFGSVDYLYSKIDLIQSKIKSNDTVFFKSIGLNPKVKILNIKIEPIVDVFKFVNNNEKNLEVLKLVAADGDLKVIENDKTTLKNYPFYVINFSTKNAFENQKTATALMAFFNESAYFSSIQKMSIENFKKQITENEQLITQIDGILNNFSNLKSNSGSADKLVYYNENVQLNDIIKTKETLLRDNRELKVELISGDKIIKENAITTSIENLESVNGKLKLMLPILFVLLFVVIFLFKRYYKSQSQNN